MPEDEPWDAHLRLFGSGGGRRMFGSARLGEILVSEGLITAEQLDLALQEQHAGAEWRVGRLLVQSGAIDEATLTNAVAKQFHVKVWNPRANPPRVSALKALVPDAALQLRALPIAFADGALVVAVSDPPTRGLRTALERAARQPVHLVLCQADELTAALEYWYAVEPDDDAPPTFDVDSSSAWQTVTGTGPRSYDHAGSASGALEALGVPPTQTTALRTLITEPGGLVVVAVETAELARLVATALLAEAQELERVVVYAGPQNGDPGTGVIRLPAHNAGTAAVAMQAAAWLGADVVVVRTRPGIGLLAATVGAVADGRTTILVCDDTNVADAVVALYEAVGGLLLAEALRAVVSVTGHPDDLGTEVRTVTEAMRQALLDPDGPPDETREANAG